MVIRDERIAQEREMRSENTKLHRLLELINKYDPVNSVVALEMTVSIRAAPASVFLTNKVFETTTRQM